MNVTIDVAIEDIDGEFKSYEVSDDALEAAAASAHFPGAILTGCEKTSYCETQGNCK